jgi:cystathionine beta-lyase
MAVSPDDCSLALRGLQTLGVRLERLEKTTLEVAQWLAKHPNIKAVLHPALPSCPGHEYWRRDFTGSSSIFSIVFDARFTPVQVISFADRLTLFKIGFSWGGVTSLVVVYPNLDRAGHDYGGRLVRLNVGLEESSDLIADLDRALRTMDAPA